MNNKLLIAVISLLFAGIVNGQNVTITASLDSAYILMGNQTKMHIEIVEDNDVTGESDFFLGHKGERYIFFHHQECHYCGGYNKDGQ